VTDSRPNAGEQLALVLTDHGMQRMNARVLAALLTTERETLTQGELAEELEVAAGSVSGAVKQALGVGLVERVHVAGSRREHYRLRDDAWARLFTRQNEATEAVLAAARAAREAADEDGPARRRLDDMCGFYDYLLAELPALLDRWRALRDR
jgi:DNA-binding transcriptional regulator GbsR (MarR family)